MYTALSSLPSGTNLLVWTISPAGPKLSNVIVFPRTVEVPHFRNGGRSPRQCRAQRDAAQRGTQLGSVQDVVEHIYPDYQRSSSLGEMLDLWL